MHNFSHVFVLQLINRSALYGRPAPLVVAWLGNPVGLGDERYHHYIITDRISTRVDTDASNFSEKMLYMPHTFTPCGEECEDLYAKFDCSR
jgi:predicted O-linked N-acetylglucosamine transferase (SPINDLY family)